MYVKFRLDYDELSVKVCIFYDNIDIYHPARKKTTMLYHMLMASQYILEGGGGRSGIHVSSKVQWTRINNGNLY